MYHVGSYSPEMAVLKAIAEEGKKEAVKSNTVKNDDSLTGGDISNPFNDLHSLNPVAAKHAEARVKVERILLRARKYAENQDIPPIPFFPMLQFAQCFDPLVPQDCSATYRSVDGTCNNIDNPLWGATGTAFRRLLPSEYEDDIYVPIGANQAINGTPFAGPWPSPRHISRFVTTDSTLNNQSVYNMFFTTFGQAIALDFSRFVEFNFTCPRSCNNLTEYLPFCWPIPVEPDDPIYGNNTLNQGECRPFRRGVGQCMTPFNSTFTQSREQINLDTHYLDASVIYGSSEVEARMVRTFTGGQLRQSARNNTYKGDLPILTDEDTDFGRPSFFFAGDPRIENTVHQMVMLTLWYRLHNNIVGRLAEINPCWDDERLFQEGRKIVVAIWQIIIYREYLPLLFGDQFEKYIGDYTGYNASVDASIPTSFAVAAGRFGHSMVRDLTDRLDREGNSIEAGPLRLRESFFNPEEYYNGGGVDPLVHGMLQDQSRELDQFLTVVLTTELFPPSPVAPFGDDLASLNIQRTREFGVPPYRTWQRYCQNIYNVTATFRSSVDQQLRDVYGEDGYRDGMDLWVGGLSEQELSDSSPLGPTFACIIGQTYSNLRDGDRFYWENPSMFNNAQRESLSQMTMSQLICVNADNIPYIRSNAFTFGGGQFICNSFPSVDYTLWRDIGCNGTEWLIVIN